MGEAEERDPRGREDRARPAAAHSHRSSCQCHPREICRCQSFWPCLCRRTTPLPPGTPLKSSRPTGAEIAAALCSFIPSLHVAIEAVSAFGKASGAEASVAANFGQRETSSVDAFGLRFRVSR
ncbi:uncharacterized protein DS421_19g658440 [Arachis hypogaea]|uniref:Uncharacterized protein n=1 Tax=Arachis hypogaea TaxID=3818 RepID=A0A6B9VBK4_ARAHY|nr:uncharacterized protein DS421_19g658440 [Arachis hypogaea]